MSFSNEVRIKTNKKNKQKILLVKKGKSQKSNVCQLLMFSRKNKKTPTNLGVESLYNPGSISPEALSRDQM